MTCPGCGAEVVNVKLPDGTNRVLDAHAREFSGPDRYMIMGEDAGRADPVSPGFEGYAYGDHEKMCPSAVRAREIRERKL